MVGDDCDDADPELFSRDTDGDGEADFCGWSLAAGGYHTCVVTHSGALQCWGHNDFGQSTPP